MTADNDKMRIDKWLWAARFQNAHAHAKCGGSGTSWLTKPGVKPARRLLPGDMLDIRIGRHHFVVEVLALSAKRGGAPDAQKLYCETEASRTRRAALAAQLRAQPRPLRFEGPTHKRDRR